MFFFKNFLYIGKIHITEFSGIQFRIPIKRRDEKKWEMQKLLHFSKDFLHGLLPAKDMLH